MCTSASSTAGRCAGPHRLLEGAGITEGARWLKFFDVDEVDPERCIELVREAARVAAMTRSKLESCARSLTRTSRSRRPTAPSPIWAGTRAHCGKGRTMSTRLP